jgi:hypothetical protein
MSWEGGWIGGWAGEWSGAGAEPGEGGFANGAALGLGTATATAQLLASASLSALGFGLATGTVLSGDAPAASGGGSRRRFYAPTVRPFVPPRRVQFVLNIAAIGTSRSTGTATLRGDFDVTGKVQRRIFQQRRNIALALAA